MQGFAAGGELPISACYIFETAQILNDAWRIPYLLSVPMTLWIAHIRKSLPQPTVSNSSIAPPKAKFKILDQFYNLSKLVQSGLIPLVLPVGFMEVCVYTLVS